MTPATRQISWMRAHHLSVFSENPKEPAYRHG